MRTTENYSVCSFVKKRLQACGYGLLSFRSGQNAFFNKFDKALADVLDYLYTF